MITVEDKLRSFSDSIIEKVHKDSEQKFQEFYERNNRLIELEKKNILIEAEKIVEQMKIKAEAEKNQIISKAHIDKEYALLLKRNQIFQQVIEEIRKKAEGYVKRYEYENFLLSCINNGLAFMKEEAIILITKSDLERYRNKIASLINREWAGHLKVKIEEASSDILGGCIVENGPRTLRMDFSIAAMINDNREMIGKTLMENI